MSKQLPSIGRIVHYTNLGDKDGRYPPEIQAAMITGVYKLKANAVEGEPNEAEAHVKANQVGDVPSSMFADLRIFYRTGEFLMERVPYSEGPARGHWNWPPRN